MAADLVRLSNRSRSLFALATVAALVFMASAAILEVTNPGQDYDGSNKYYVQRGNDYLVAQEIFWPGFRMSGVWHSSAFAGGVPDEVRLVAGSDVSRILAGQEPEHLYGSFPPWNPGQGVGDLHFVVPEFRCTGPNGGCEQADLPAIVFTRGDDWEGQPMSALQRENLASRLPGVSLSRNEAWVLPVTLWMTAFATVAAVAAIAAGITWRVMAKRAPSAGAQPLGPVPLEASLRLVDLSRLYLSSIQRSLYLGGAVVLLGGLAIQVFGLPALDEIHNNYFPFGPEAAHAWFSAMHWLVVPFGLLVSGVFWVRQLRLLRAEQARWDLIAGRLSTLEQQVLG